MVNQAVSCVRGSSDWTLWNDSSQRGWLVTGLLCGVVTAPSLSQLKECVHDALSHRVPHHKEQGAGLNELK